MKKRKWVILLLFFGMLWILAEQIPAQAESTAAAAAHAHSAACYDGTVHKHSGNSSSGGGCYGHPNYSSYSCSGCYSYSCSGCASRKETAYCDGCVEKWSSTYSCSGCVFISCDSNDPKHSCPACWECPSNHRDFLGYVCSGHTTTVTYCTGHTTCYGHIYVAYYSVNCGYTEGAYYKGSTKVSPTCSNVVTSVALTHANQTINHGVAGDYSATLSFLDGTSKVVTGTCNYNPDMPTSYGEANSYTVTFAEYNRVGTASTVQTPTAVVKITTQGLRGISAATKYQIVSPGEEIDTSFIAVMAGGAERPYASGVAVFNYDKWKEGEQAVTITYTMDESHSDTIYVYVIPMPVTLAVSSNQTVFYYDQIPAWNLLVTFRDGTTLSDVVTASKTLENHEMTHVFADGNAKAYTLPIKYTITDIAGAYQDIGDRYADHTVQIGFELVGKASLVEQQVSYRSYQRMTGLRMEHLQQILYRGESPDTSFWIVWEDGAETFYENGGVLTYTGAAGQENVMLSYTLAAMEESVTGSGRILTLPLAAQLDISGERNIKKGTLPFWQAAISYEDGSIRTVCGTETQITDIQVVEIESLQRTYYHQLNHFYRNLIDGETGKGPETGGRYEVSFSWLQDGAGQEILTDTVELTVWDSCGQGLGHADFAADSCPFCDTTQELMGQMDLIKNQTLTVLQGTMEADRQSVEEKAAWAESVFESEILERFRPELMEEMILLREGKIYFDELVNGFDDVLEEYARRQEAVRCAETTEKAALLKAEAAKWMEEYLEEYEEQLLKVSEGKTALEGYWVRSQEIKNSVPLITLPELIQEVYCKGMPALSISVSSPLSYDMTYAIPYEIKYSDCYPDAESLELAKKEVLPNGENLSILEQAEALLGAGFLQEAPGFLRAGVYEVWLYTVDPDYQNTAACCSVVIRPKEVTVVGAARSKRYDASDQAEVFCRDLTGVLEGDQVIGSFSGDARFQTVYAGVGIPVIWTGLFGLEGEDAANYTVSSVVVTGADILPRETASFSVKIPKKVIMDGRSEISHCRYQIQVSGELPDGDRLFVEPDSILVFYQNGKEEVQATVTQERVEFTPGDNLSDKEELSAGVTTEGEITAVLSAGNWKGTLAFRVRHQESLGAGIYDKGICVKAWEELLGEGLIMVRDGILLAGDEVGEVMLTGETLILPEEIISMDEKAVSMMSQISYITTADGTRFVP